MRPILSPEVTQGAGQATPPCYMSRMVQVMVGAGHLYLHVALGHAWAVEC